MRYDEEKGIIDIDFTELVRIAQRELSPTPIYDEDEPEGSFGKQRRNKSEPLSLDFTVGEYSFRLHALPDETGEGEITLVREVSSIKKPKKEEEKTIKQQAKFGRY